MEEFLKDKSNLVLIGCMFLGIAIGMKQGEVGFGTMLGLGVGFITKYYLNKKDNKENEKLPE